MADPPRAIVHLDLDAFFASVEVLENRHWRQAGSVGGRPEERASSRRFLPGPGVRIHSAMPMARPGPLSAPGCRSASHGCTTTIPSG